MQHQDNINSAILLGVFSNSTQVKRERSPKPIAVNGTMPKVAPSGFEALRNIADGMQP